MFFGHITDMAWFIAHWSSSVLGKSTSTQILVPDSGKPPFPVFYLLHGLSDDSTMWMRRTRIEAYAASLPLIVVMPDGYRGFYTDNNQGPAFAKHIGEELPSFIERTFPAKEDRSARAIGGLSMGGYGALRVGLEYRDRFCSINSHSGALGFGRTRRRALPEFDNDEAFQTELFRVFGPSPDGTNHDLLALAKQAKKERQLPRILIDCGTEDFLLGDNRDFVEDLRSAKIPHTYKEHPGQHNWDYWNTHIQEALLFHSANLGKA